MQGLDTDQPKLLLPDGTRFKGNYEDNLGTILVFASKAAAVCDQHPEDMEVDGRASAASEATESGTAAARSAHQQASDDLQYLCHTEKVLAFTEVKDGGRRG